MERSSNLASPWAGPAWLVSSTLLLAVLVLTWRLWDPPAKPPGNDPTAKPRTVAPPGPPTSEEEKRIDIFNKVKVSVVNIASALLRRDSFTLNVQQVPKGSGTGFMWDEKGRIVTNYHVVEGADRVQVTLSDHTTYDVQQIRSDKNNDVAVLWVDIPSKNCKPIPLGESSKLRVGQSVLAIGNPFGLDHSLSTGIVSALGRDLKTDEGRVERGLIQTDAAINPGNSGGPLLDSSGRLIGVNAAILSPSGGWAGIGFAIPVDVVNRVVPRLISGSKEAHPSLGIVEAPDQWAKQRGIDGVLVINVIPGGAADKAKVHPTRRDQDTGDIVWGDIITAIDKHPIHSANEMYALLESNYKVGQEITLHVVRGENELDLKLTLSSELR